MNLRHGLFCANDVILPGESEADFEKLVEELRASPTDARRSKSCWTLRVCTWTKLA